MSKPAFDPSQPFEVVKPTFDETQPSEPVEDKPEFDPNQPFEAASDTEVSGKAPDYLNAAKLGVREALAPMGVTKEEEVAAEGQTTGEKTARIASGVVADIGTSLLATAGAGALVGSLAGPGPGTVAGFVAGGLYGLYKAYGQEKLHQTVTGEEVSPGRIALGTLAEVNPLIHYSGGMASKVAKGLSQAGLDVARAKSYGASNMEAGIAGTVGGVMSGAFHRAPEREGLMGLIGAPAVKPLDSTGQPPISRKLLEKGMEGIQAKIDSDIPEAQLGRLVTRKMVETQDESKAFKTMLNLKSEDFADIQTLHDALGPERVAQIENSIRPHRLQTSEQSPAWVVAELGAITDDIPAGMPTKTYTALTLFDQEYRKFAGFSIDPTLSRASHMNPAELLKEFDQVKSKILMETEAGMKHAENTYDMYRTQKYSFELLNESHAEHFRKFGLDPLRNQVIAKLQDQTYALRAIDHATGENLSVLGNNLSNSMNAHTVMMEGFQTIHKDLLRASKRAKLDPHETFALLTDPELRAAQWDKIRPEAKEYLGKWQKAWEGVREEGRRGGIAIGKLEDYAPQAAKDTGDLITSIRREYEKLLQRNGAENVRNPSSKVLKSIIDRREESLSHNQFLRVLEHYLGDAIENPQDLRRAVNKISDFGVIKTKMGYEARASFARKGEIPKFIQETDVNRLFLSATENLSKTINLRDVLQEIGSKVPILHSMEMDGSAGYVERLLKAVSGGSDGGLGAAMSASATKWKVALDKVLDTNELSLPGLRWGVKTAKDIPEFMGMMMSQIYPNYLGLAIRGPARNLFQPVFMTGPEIGGLYGQKLVLKAIASTTSDRIARGTNLTAFLKAHGWQPAQFSGESHRIIRNAFAENPVLRKSANMLDKWSEFAMKLYASTDSLNRYVTYKVAQHWAEDLAAHNPKAIEALGKIGEGYKMTIDRAMRRGGNMEDVAKLLADHLIAKTQFNYGKHALGEYARSLGPMCSMFSKWPLTIASMAHEGAVQGKGIKPWKAGSKTSPLAKIMAPWAALALVDNWLVDTKDSPRMRALVGYGGLKDMAPGASLSTVADITRPPVIESAASLAGAAVQAIRGDREKAAKLAKKAVLPFVPFYGVKRAMDSYGTLVTGKEQK